jgi:hypothetical protein
MKFYLIVRVWPPEGSREEKGAEAKSPVHPSGKLSVPAGSYVSVMGSEDRILEQMRDKWPTKSAW